MATPIKLFKLDTMKDGAIRFKSQLYLKRQVCDFILKDEIMYHWTMGVGGIGFHETDIPYEIVENVEEMKMQKL